MHVYQVMIYDLITMHVYFLGSYVLATTYMAGVIYEGLLCPLVIHLNILLKICHVVEIFITSRSSYISKPLYLKWLESLLLAPVGDLK